MPSWSRDLTWAEKYVAWQSPPGLVGKCNHQARVGGWLPWKRATLGEITPKEFLYCCVYWTGDLTSRSHSPQQDGAGAAGPYKDVGFGGSAPSASDEHIASSSPTVSMYHYSTVICFGLSASILASHPVPGHPALSAWGSGTRLEAWFGGAKGSGQDTKAPHELSQNS